MKKATHIAIIPDGNRRWAKDKGNPGSFGHKKGAETLEEIIEESFDLEIPYLTFWGLSISNIQKRSKKEVSFLFNIFDNYFKELADKEEIHQNRVKVRVLGKWREFFPDNVKEAIEEVIKKTENYGQKYNLTFLLAYSGTEEIKHAVENIVKENREEELEITNGLIKNNLYTKELPSVDLVIRTGGEPHWSDGFMMWDVANAQLRFTNVFFPAFSREEFRKVVKEYGGIERRFGR